MKIQFNRIYLRSSDCLGSVTHTRKKKKHLIPLTTDFSNIYRINIKICRDKYHPNHFIFLQPLHSCDFNMRLNYFIILFYRNNLFFWSCIVVCLWLCCDSICALYYISFQSLISNPPIHHSFRVLILTFNPAYPNT